MKSAIKFALGAALLASVGLTSFAAAAKNITVGVSWSNFQEERWKTDEAAIKGALDKVGAKYISADAQASPSKQLTDVESLISKGANVLIILAMDNEAILPALKKATDEGIPVIAYDRLIESPNVLYITFDNVGVGRMMAKAIQAAKPAGNYAFIKGDKGDANSNFLFSGITEVLKPAMDAGKIKNVGESYTDGWKPDNAQKNMEQILTKNNNKVDAVVAENDGMAGGAIAALAAQGLAGSVPVSGQDGDHAAINRIAQGTQTVSIWKDSRDLGKTAGEAALELANGKKRSQIAGVKPFNGGPKHTTVDGILLTPLAVTRDNLDVIVDKGWITKAEVCNGVKPGTVKFCG
ncbi:MAG: D-xylose ABC transporter substrate-binding protein [Hyphomicrobiales bacterium]|nr:D-xylose ABC transporter substrate-binding protein [Hyphomicrobiales bacterium]